MKGNYISQLVRGYLNVNTLQHRRFEADLRFLHKILVGQIQSPQLVEFNVNSRMTRNSEIFHIPLCHTNYGLNEPINRILRNANSNINRLEFFDSSCSSFKKNGK